MGAHYVRMKRTDDKRHCLLSKGGLCDRKIHAVTFNTPDDARKEIVWLFEHNPDGFISGQVVLRDGMKVIETLTPEKTPA